MDQSVLFTRFVSFIAAVRQVSDDITKDVKTDAITPAQYSILEYIAVNQPVTLSQISDCQRMSMPNTSRELKKLGEKNLCEKFDVAEDRRKQYIHLSPAGQALMNDAFSSMEAHFRHRIREASGEELQEIEHALRVLHSKVFY